MLAISTCRPLSIVAAFAVAVSGLLPSPHVHSGHARTIIHVHVVTGLAAPHDGDAEDHDHVTLDHADHATARTIADSYDVAAGFVLAVATMPTSVPVGTSDAAAFHHLNRTEILPTHDPPLRFTSSPAPPAVV